MKQARRIENKRGFFDYLIEERIEAGLVLTGEEVKAFRAGQVSLGGSFVRPLFSAPDKKSELWLLNAQFAQVAEPDRSKKLLLHRQEIDRLLGKVTEKGLTLVPLTLFLKGGKIKVEVGLARGKKHYEKRETIKKRDIERTLRQTLKER